MDPTAINETGTVSAFPAPPMQFISKYTDESVRNNSQPKPPPIPQWPQYSIFGQDYTVSTEEPIITSLESQGIARLHPQKFDHREELKKMNHSILVNFLDLIDILIRNPAFDAAREQKLDQLNDLFIHMMHLVNEFRPHQARETVKVMLKAQLTQRKDVCERMKQFYDKLDGQFKTYMQVVPDNIKLEAEKAAAGIDESPQRLQRNLAEETLDIEPENQVNAQILNFPVFSSSYDPEREDKSKQDSNIASALDLLDSSY